METWYAVEYSYSKYESDNVLYRGRKEFKTFEELEKFMTIVLLFSERAENFNKLKQCHLFRKYFGKEGKFAGLSKVFKYTKNEIPLISRKHNHQIAINM